MPDLAKLPGVSRAVAAALLCAALVLAPRSAAACGGHTHAFIALQAVQLLPDGALRTLLTDAAVQQALLNGVPFPDGGYATSNGYGETAHWEPYQRALLQHIRKNHPLLEQDPDARLTIAFLFGMVAHGMADQVYDSLFMASAHVHDNATWKDELLTSFDTATDVFQVVQQGPSPQVQAWMPLDDVLAAYAALGEPDPGESLSDGQTLMTTVAAAYPKATAANAAKVAELRAMYPWAYDHLSDANRPGTPLCAAKIVAAYWQSLWQDLHGAQPTLRVMATVPTAGASHPFGQATDPDSKVAVVLSRGLDAKALSSEAVVVRDAAGELVAAEQDLFYGENSHVIVLKPKADWPTGQTLHLEVRAGIRSFDGVVSSEAESFAFTVGAAAPKEPGQPPPGSPWQLRGAGGNADAGDAAGGADAVGDALGAGAQPHATADGGCRAARRGSDAASWLLVALGLGCLVWRRRARPCR